MSTCSGLLFSKKKKIDPNVLKDVRKTNHPIKKFKKNDKKQTAELDKKKTNLIEKLINYKEDLVEDEKDPFIENIYICSKGKIYFFRKNVMTDTQVSNSFKFITDIGSKYCEKNFPLQERVVSNKESVNFGKLFRVRIAVVDNDQFVSGTMEWVVNEEEDLETTEEFDLT